MAQKKKIRSISRQVILNFCWFAVLISAVFSMVSFMFLFTVEDEFLRRELNEEATFVLESHAETGQWPLPQKKHMQVYPDRQGLPEDLRDQYIGNPQQQEFYGLEGRHYHVHVLDGVQEVLLVAEVSKSLIIRPLRKILLTTFGVLALLLTAMGCFIAYRIARKSIAPLTRLADFVEQTSPENLPDNFADDYPANEVGKLAEALQKSMGRISRFIKREQHFNRDVSHDLRTPIAVVSSAVEVLQKHHELEPAAQELLDRIAVANTHMARTVEALLSLAREDDAKQLAEPIKILPVLEKTIIQHAHILDGKDVEVDVQVSPAATLNLQVGVLEILLSNLIGNAFQYTAVGVVSISCEGGKLTVSDTGGGVAKNLKDSMFKDYAKGHESSGFGLGLSIVKRICEHHKIAVEVQHLENGTAVQLTF